MLSESCETLKGVGKVLSEKLAKCKITNLADLIFYLPYRYQDKTHITPIQDLRAKEHAVIAGKLVKTEVKMGKRRMLYCYVDDNTALLKLRFFHFNRSQLDAMNNCKSIRAFGEVNFFSNQFEMIHPEYTLYQENEPLLVEETLTPVYPATEGLSQSKLRQLICTVLIRYQPLLETLEWIPQDELKQRGFLSIATAITLLHNPPPEIAQHELEDGTHPAIRRLAFEELLAQRLNLEIAKENRAVQMAPIFLVDSLLEQRFRQSLPFSCTSAQNRVVEEIYADLALSKPMLRLVQGDVGCGKTVVATLSCLPVISKGYQVAFMAPTDLLSEQHFNNLQQLLAPLNIKVGRLTGKMRVKERRELLADIADNTCQLIIGTHALFQEQVQFCQLGLVIIDEQHRFGVEQRLQLQQKAKNGAPHQLLMTATPIPRSLAMTKFAHIDISIIDEIPPGRSAVQTVTINQTQREVVVDRLALAIENKKQVYWVCGLIDESEKLQCSAATETHALLQQLLPEARIGLIHGRIKAAEKELIMQQFKTHQLDLLVATTVIEVGVDVPNASLMIIENSERLGLAQLHQLRGRVGRGTEQSYCILLFQTPLSMVSKERLQTMRTTNDGFVIAEKDLQLRGSGELLGTRQTGYQQFRIARLPRDSALLNQTALIAQHLLHNAKPLAIKIIENWQRNAHEFLQS